MKIFANIGFLCWLLVLSIYTTSHGQSGNQRLEHLTEGQGLSQNSVWSIHQDREGFMWFGTQDGLNKYDGYTFTVFKPDPHDPEHTLHHNIISDIHEDRQDRLWVTTLGGGLHQVDKHTGNVTRYGIKPTQSVLWNGLASIYEDRQGSLWISGYGGVASFNPDRHTFTLFPVPSHIVWLTSVTEDAAGQLWAAGSGGIYQLNRSTGIYTPIILDSSLSRQPDCWSLYLDKEGILWAGSSGEGLFYMNTRQGPLHFSRYMPGGSISKSFRFNSIYEDPQGSLWLSGSQGLQRINKQRDQVFDFQTPSLQYGSLNQHIVSSVFQDRTGTLWIGSDNGIRKVTAYGRKFHAYQIKPSLPSLVLQENTISTILEDYTGKIWLGSAGSSLNGNFENGLFQFDPVSKQIIHFPANASDPYSLASNQVWSLYEDQHNRLWVGTEEALHLFDPSTGKFKRYPTDIPVEQIDEDAYGKLWIGGRSTYSTASGGIASFDSQESKFRYYMYDPSDSTGLKDGDVYDIVVSRMGDVWVALSGGGIARLSRQTGRFTSYLPGATAVTGHLNDKDVRVLYQDAEGVIWAGTNQGGLHRFDSLTNSFAYFTMKDGLPSNHIESITGDARGNLWLGTNKGISRFNPKTKTFRNFDVTDGLPANEFKVGSVYSRNGKLMFGSVNGYVIFHPDSIRDNTTVPPVYITAFKVMDDSKDVPTGQVTLPYNQNFLSFDFVALNYDTPEKNQYAYRMEGVHKDWVYNGTRRFASYANLTPGNYTFQVKASNNDGIWNEQGTSIRITILPPPWQTWWAYSLYGLLGICLLYGLRQTTVKRERLKHALKLQRLQAEKMQEIDQMKSHFFANISHEFRTPLTLILGPLEKFIARTPIENEDKPVYLMMQRNAQRLLHLINQLLDLSKLEAGSMKLEPKPADILSFLKATVYSFTSLAESRQIHYDVYFPATQQPVMCFDADKLEKIVVNLLSNAFKFTPQGGVVTVTAELQEIPEEKKAPKQRLTITVKDSGIGIPPEQLDNVFNRFYQINDSYTRPGEGTGIGLALTKELTELHGGQISLTSHPGIGSAFTVSLPLEVAGQTVNLAAQDTVPLPANSRHSMQEESEQEDIEELVSASEKKLKQKMPLLLLVEDNADIRRYIRENLSSQYRIAEAINGEEGIEQALQQMPDLIVSDIMMPVVDGMELCHRIKTDERTSHIPVILLTAKAGEESQLQGLETGADDYLTKPFSFKELQARIRNLIEQRARLQAHFSRKISVEPKEIAVTSADEKFLQRALAIMEANMDNAEFDVETFCRELGMSRTHLHRKLKALTNLSVSDFIRTIRLKRAAQLLSQKAGNISEIAYMVGFKEQSYFSRCFHQTFGCTPSEYVAKSVIHV